MAMRQNGCRGPLPHGAIFVWCCMGVLLLYAPHVARADDECDAIKEALVIPEDNVTCLSGGRLLYKNLPQDQALGQLYTLPAADGVQIISFTKDGDPEDADFYTYFSTTQEENTISVDIIGSLEDYGDYSEDGTGGQNTAISSIYTLTYQKETKEQITVSINRFQFSIDDVDNKSPEFESDTYSISLREDWLVDFEIPNFNVNVRDRDQTLKKSVHLNFDDSCPLDTSDGSLDVSLEKGDYTEITFKLKAKLDHEANPTVTCTLTATDEGDNEGSTTIEINIEAGQDEPPAFDYVFYKIDMTGNESPGDALSVQPAAIHAVDQDDPPTEITYTMHDAEDGIIGTDYFEISKGTADIKLKQELDDDFLNEHDQLRFVIYATDEVKDQDKAFLEINLPKPLTTTVMTTTTETGTTVSESTPTATTSGTTTTTITTPSSGPTEGISTESTSCPPCECTTTPYTTPFTSPTTSTPSTTITTCPPCPTTELPTTTTPATTTHTPSGPEFLKDTYVFQTLKNMNSIGTVKATIDGVESEDVVYGIEGDDGGFKINSNTGEISKPSDTEAKYTELTVTAEANGISTKALVKIFVIEDIDPSLSIKMSLHEVLVKEEVEGETIGNVTYLGDEAEAKAFCVIYQEGVDNYKDISFKFSANTLKLKDEYKLDRENVQQVRVWVEIFNSTDPDCSGHYKDEGPTELLRSQGLFVIEVEDVNDHTPTFDYPKSDITLAYPEDLALQKVVGPVIQLRASDLDDSEYISYTLEDGDNNFVVDQESGAVFWEGEEDSLGTSCGDGCSFTVKAQDKDQNASDPVKCTVVSLPEDAIYTLSFPNMALSEVEEKLEKLSDDIDMTVRALYVTPKPGSTTRGNNYNRYSKYFNTRNYIRDDVHGTPFNLDVHVSVLDESGKIVSLDDFNSALSEDSAEAINAEAFKDKEVFHLAADPDDVLGYQIAVGVTGGLLGILLLAFVIMAIIRYRKRSERRRGPEVPNPRRSYGNQGYVNDDIKQHDTLDGNSIKMNGTVNGFHEPPRAGRDSPPLNQSPLAVASDTLPRGLRRTAPEHVPNLGQPASREPPAQFKEPPTQQQKKPLQTPASAVAPVAAATSTTALGGARTSAADQTPAKMQPTAEPAPLTQAVGSSTYNNSSSYQPRQKKEPPPLTAAPKKSALKGTGGTTPSDSQKTKEPQMPLSTMAPAEPAADYDSSPGKMATSSFSNLKTSPPPKKKEQAQTKPDEDANKEGDDKPPERKKSNMKTMTESDSNDQDKKTDQDKRKNSVAFKVLVEQKTIEPENEGPAAKKQAENEAKAETNQAAVDIMEANKKKLDDDDDDTSKL